MSRISRASRFQEAQREVVEERREGNWTLRLEFVKCGKGSCHCAGDRGHGPYWYAYWREDGKLRSRYLGSAKAGRTPGEETPAADSASDS